MRHPQLNQHGELRHLITTEGLSRALLTRLLDTTERFIKDAAQSVSLETDILEVRSCVSGMPYVIAQQVGAQVHIINAGDGSHADPLRALSNLFTIRAVKKEFSNLTVVIVGDILHSRVARSTIHALTTLGVAQVRVVGPLTVLPEGLAQLGVRASTEMVEGLKDADVIILLEFEHGRTRSGYLPSEQEFFKCYGLPAEILACAKPDCLVLDGEVAQGAVDTAVRQAVISILAGASS